MTHNKDLGWVVTISINPPTLDNNTAYIDRVTTKLKQIYKTDNIYISLSLLRKIPNLLRKWDHNITCVVFRNSLTTWTLIHITNPENTEIIAGLAVDLGTSRVALRIVDLVNSNKIGEKIFDNPQISVGADVLDRIRFSYTYEGLNYLNILLLNSLNKHINTLCYSHSLTPAGIYIVTVSGNTIMTHLFLGITPAYTCKEPYIPSINTPGVLKAKEIGIKVNPNAQTFIFPNVGSYFGGDLIAGILYSGLNQKKKTSLLVDVGTNAEVVLGNNEWMIACAGAAGPALESSVTTVGAMAGAGIIDSVTIDPNSKRIKFTTIGNLPPKGICGSGIIDLASQLFLTGLIDARGNFLTQVIPEFFIKKKGSNYLMLVPSEQSATGNAITIAQTDITSLIRSKAAMYTILETITIAGEINQDELDSFFIAGSFGLYINPKSAITIGMLPDIPLKRYKSIGNSSLGGATTILQNIEAIGDVDLIKNNITYIELNINQDFMNRLSAAIFLPHTDISKFPNCNKKANI